MTSFTFMLVCVPLPVWNTTSGKCSSSFPAITSSAAAMIAPATSLSSRPSRWLYCAAHFFSTPNARITCSGIRAASPPIGKFISERAVCAPYSLSAGTGSGPNESDSVRVAAAEWA